MTAVHPDLDAEQTYVANAYRSLDSGLAMAEKSFADYQAGDRTTNRAMQRALAILRDSKSHGQLVFGRIDRGDDEPLYVGRRVVFDEDRNVLVAGWYTPAAQAFYEATAEQPGDVDLKRVFVEEDRRVMQILDEIVRGSARQVTALPPGDDLVSDALLAELDRSRDGAMRDVVATIQSEQYRIIRAPREGVLVVQGGPGTGKTVIGLHRAAWLALNDEALRRQGLLVVSPNSTLLSYTSGVLPTLHVDDLHQTDIGGLYVGEASVRATDDPLAARVKGSAEMAEVLRRALAARIGWGGDDLSLTIGPMRVVLPRADLVALVDDVRARRVSHSEGRTLVRESLSRLAFEGYREATRQAGRLAQANEAAIRRLAAFTNAVDRMWPAFTPEEFLRSLYGTQSSLVAAAEGVITAEERAALFRPQAPAIGDEPWTDADLVCLDELSGLLNADETRYGHVVVDEAQDLTPMQARALARRCPSGSFTILGDLAQATGAFIRDEWSELTEHLSETPSRVETLRFCYRVPGAALELAARQLPLISPSLEAPTSVRPGRVRPLATWAEEGDLLDQAVLAARTAAEEGSTTAIVVPDALYDELVSKGDLGNGREGDFSRPVSAVPASLAKGLEFDTVVVAAPERFLTDHVHGRRLLYIALTRCTQELRLVHTADLPAGLEHLDLRATPVVEELVEFDLQPEESAETPQDEPDLAALIAALDDEDRRLVHDLVVRLLSVQPRTTQEEAES